MCRYIMQFFCIHIVGYQQKGIVIFSQGASLVAIKMDKVMSRVEAMKDGGMGR